MRNTVLEQRVRAAWRARASAAAVGTGAMIFCVGAGIAVPISLNAAAISSLPALALAALIAWRAQRAQKRPAGEPSKLARALWGTLTLALALNAAYLAAAQVNLAERTLMYQATVGVITTVTFIAVAVCALCGSAAVARICFSVRIAMPVLLLVLGAKALQRGTPVGLFPVLGAGAVPLLWSSACMLCAAAPALLLLCPADGPDGGSELVPPARFFVLRVLAGGAVGVLLLSSLTLCNTFDTLLSRAVWGDRMTVTCTHEPRLGVLQTALVLTQMLGLALACAALLSGAERAASQAAKGRGGRAAFAVCLLIAGIALLAMERAGFERSLYAAPALLVPAAPVLALAGSLRGRKAKGASR